MTEPTTYDPSFYSQIQDGSLLSARQVVPTLLTLLQPKSVVDLGCGTGAWLSAFKQNGVEDFLGFDGDYVDRGALLIPPERFKPADLAQPLQAGRRFDLAISVEVAEHLPAAAADTFMNNLAALSDTVVFSAAIPLQGGNHHVNEQWPEYWKARFEARGYTLIDCLRGRFWNNRDVERWYRQNLFLYVKEARLNASPVLKEEYERSKNNILSAVHPAVYLSPSLSGLLQMIPRTLISGMRRRFKKS